MKQTERERPGSHPQSAQHESQASHTIDSTPDYPGFRGGQDSPGGNPLIPTPGVPRALSRAPWDALPFDGGRWLLSFREPRIGGLGDTSPPRGQGRLMRRQFERQARKAVREW